MNPAALVIVLLLISVVGYGAYTTTLSMTGYDLPGDAELNNPSNAAPATTPTPTPSTPTSTPPSAPTPAVPVPTPQVSAATLFFNQQTYFAAVGSMFTVRVMAAAQSLRGWEWHLTFDPDIVSAVSVVQGSFLQSSGLDTFFIDSGGYNDCCGIHNEAGYVWLVEVILGACNGASGTGCLAEVTFQTVKPGSFTLRFTDAKLATWAGNGPVLMPLTLPEAMVQAS